MVKTSKENYYQFGIDNSFYLVQNRNDFDTFLGKYISTIQKLLSLNNDQMNEASTYFERHANIILKIQSKRPKQRK